MLVTRNFRASATSFVVKPFLLADIGEGMCGAYWVGGRTKGDTGIRECEVIQWFVEPEARVEQFDKLCEVQSDKASVEVCVLAIHLYVWGVVCVCIVCVLTV